MKNSNSFNNGSDFHAGRFLSDVMQAAGRDVAWLSAQTGMDEQALEALLAKPNMDARLFVEVGEKIDPLFFQRLDETILGQAIA